MMTLDSLGNIGEFVGALGVVISLVYLARQMHQNTLSVRAASFNSMIQNSIRLLEHAFRDSEFADFLARAEADPDTLTPAERVRWDSYMTAVYRHFGNLVYQSRVGALDEQMWRAYKQDLKHHLRTPSWATWYDEHKIVFSEALTEHVEQALRDIAEEGDGLPTPGGGSAAGAVAHLRRQAERSVADAPEAGPRLEAAGSRGT